MLRRIWFEFNLPLEDAQRLGIARGCGVTGHDVFDCLKQVQEKIFKLQNVPPTKSMTVDIDVSTLDIPNVGSSAERGIWYPRGFE